MGRYSAHASPHFRSTDLVGSSRDQTRQSGTTRGPVASSVFAAAHRYSGRGIRVRRSRRRGSGARGGGGGVALLFLLVMAGLQWLQQHPLALLLGSLLVLVVTGGVVYAYWQQRQNIRNSGILEIDRMDGHTFESKLALLFRDLGYSVKQTKTSGDFGADLVAQKNGIVTVVQAKRYSLDRKVGLGAVQEVVSAKGMYHAQRAMVITNTSFTDPARALARSNQVELWDRNDLIRALSLVRTQREYSKH